MFFFHCNHCNVWIFVLSLLATMYYCNALLDSLTIWVNVFRCGSLGWGKRKDIDSLGRRSKGKDHRNITDSRNLKSSS